MSQPQRSVCGRVGSATCLPFGSRGKGEVLFPSPIPCHLWQVGLLILDPESRTGYVPYLLQRSGEQTLHLCLGSRVGLALIVRGLLVS